MATKYLKGECSHCHGHIEFPAESTGMTADCPHCGQPTELLLVAPKAEPEISRRVVVWTFVAIVILGCGLGLALVALKRAEKWAERRKEAAAQITPMPQAEAVATNAVPEPEDPVEKAGFKISDIKIEKTKGSSLIYAVGTLNNTESRTRYGVRLRLDLFDETDRKVGTATDTQATMEPNAQWQFRALVLDKKAVKAKAGAVTEQQ
jgi:hypothetical protein